MITNYTDCEESYYCKECLDDNIQKPHYHVNIINNNMCKYCNSPNHNTQTCPFVKIRLLSTDFHKKESIFKTKLRKNSNYRLISKKKIQEKNEKVIDIVEEMSKMIINGKKKISWFDDDIQ